MKKILLILATLAILLAMSCDNGTTEQEETNPFVGTWKHESGSIYVFSKNILTCYLSDSRIYYTGTYIYDDDKITVEVDLEKSIYNINPCILNYTIDYEKLFLQGQPLIKQID